MGVGVSWQKGDLALRISSGGSCSRCGHTSEIAVGALVVVREYGVRLFDDGLDDYLQFEGFSDFDETDECVHFGYHPPQYIKVTPPAEMIKETEATDQEEVV